MQFQINRQTIELLLRPDVSLSDRDLRTFERVDHILRANPAFQKRYPKARLERATFCPEHEDCFRLLYASRHGSVEIHASRAPVVAIDLEHHRITITA